MRYGLIFAFITGLTLTLSPGAALASHYAIGDVPTLISAGDADKLKKGGVSTTEEMLLKAATAKDRKALAKASGLPAVSADGQLVAQPTWAHGPKVRTAMSRNRPCSPIT